MQGGEDVAVDIRSHHGGGHFGGDGDGGATAPDANATLAPRTPRKGRGAAAGAATKPRRCARLSPELRRKLLLRGFPVRRALRGPRGAAGAEATRSARAHNPGARGKPPAAAAAPPRPHKRPAPASRRALKSPRRCCASSWG
jgi:hypothetical protein